MKGDKATFCNVLGSPSNGGFGSTTVLKEALLFRRNLSLDVATGRLMGRTAAGQRAGLDKGRKFGNCFGVKLKLYHRERLRLQRENHFTRRGQPDLKGGIC